MVLFCTIFYMYFVLLMKKLVPLWEQLLRPWTPVTSVTLASQQTKPESPVLICQIKNLSKELIERVEIKIIFPDSGERQLFTGLRTSALDLGHCFKLQEPVQQHDPSSPDVWTWPLTSQSRLPGGHPFSACYQSSSLCSVLSFCHFFPFPWVIITYSWLHYWVS